ncbi:D-alanyl-D-alanine carboxypeptidase [Rhodobacter sp. HX-7-19]|uniref:D-alanyl-D-alanine carboxypeptidase n=1 Tax=Paragemmobacter kunshanensis TaxID=2583234 RepID=A0A6M1U6G7_9RHOB|nr:serine hydrolase [Rhodobacter kunshanensis]NGQ89311.1 D-alanyl-D-alanine carboxypeptidase [Rhodobacter kunshanensis]
MQPCANLPAADKPHQKPGADQRQEQGTGDVASLWGHFARLYSFICIAALAAILAASPLRAAPYASIVIDARSGEVLYAENADTRLHPASLTKMMTLYIAFEEIQRGNISLDTMVTVTKHAAAQPPSRLGLRAGQKISLRNLIRAAAIKSANDAATAIGEAIAGNEADFARRMTRTAKALGMKNTTFKNANGLTAQGHLSTARDMTILGRHLFYDFPQYYNLFSRRSVDAGLATVNNTNRRFLDAYEGADGIKTGYTVAAGFNLTASADRGGKRLIATIFGGKSTADRNAKMMKLLDLGFGKAPRNAPVNPPTPPGYQGGDEMLVADADLPETADGAGKTLRVSMELASSPRPVARPGAAPAAEVPETVIATAEAVDAMQSGIEGALAAALAPEGTLESQAAELAQEAAPAASLAVDDVELASTGGSDSAPLPDAETLAAAMESTAPLPRPGDLPAEALAEADVEPEAEIIPFQVVSASGVALSPRPARRNAPIYDEVALPAPGAEEAEPEIVLSVSTSGDRHWGVNVGRFGSSYDAERALLKTQLAESATLNGSLRKVMPRGGGFDATFVGLTQDQADLACRRLQARAIQCFTMGP